MVSYENALADLLGLVSPLCAEFQASEDALGGFVAADILASLDLPPFDASAVDGYALRSEGEGGAPFDLTLLGTMAAGSTQVIPLQPAGCVRVFTGSPLPPSATAVVMQEETCVLDAGRIRFSESVKPWQNVRFRGEDGRKGEVLLAAGSRLGPAQMALLAAAGLERVLVHRSPRVALASSGDELVSPGLTLGFGQVFDCNSACLAALMRTEGALTRILPVISDTVESAMEGLVAAFEDSDLVVTAGGASVGDRDVIRPALERLGGTVRFWRIDLRPGKPFFLGEWKGKFLLGLPGNPVSAFVTAVLLVLPALRRLRGARYPAPRAVLSPLSEPFRNSGDRRHFVRVMTLEEGSVRPIGIQASHILSSLTLADGLADIPAGADLAAGTLVRVIRW